MGGSSFHLIGNVMDPWCVTSPCYSYRQKWNVSVAVTDAFHLDFQYPQFQVPVDRITIVMIDGYQEKCKYLSKSIDRYLIGKPIPLNKTLWRVCSER